MRQQQQTSTVYEHVRNSAGPINLMENLQSKLKEKDGEIVQLQVSNARTD